MFKIKKFNSSHSSYRVPVNKGDVPIIVVCMSGEGVLSVNSCITEYSPIEIVADTVDMVIPQAIRALEVLKDKLSAVLEKRGCVI